MIHVGLSIVNAFQWIIGLDGRNEEVDRRLTESITEKKYEEL